MLSLFVDDTRDFPKEGYQCCRDADSAILLLSIMKFDFISLDYCLGRDAKNGLDILIWMKENNKSVPHINIHSNHIYRDKMRTYIEENFPETVVTMNTLPR